MEKKFKAAEKGFTDAKLEQQKLRKSVDSLESAKEALSAQWRAATAEYDALRKEYGGHQEKYRMEKRAFDESDAKIASITKELQLTNQRNERMEQQIADVKGW